MDNILNSQIPGAPYLIHERAGGEGYCLLMAGLARVVAPMGLGVEQPVLTIGCSRNQFTNGTVVNFQAPPDCSVSNRDTAISKPDRRDIGCTLPKILPQN
jgi:hypothetical protein